MLWEKLEIIFIPAGAGTMRRAVIPKPLLVMGFCCIVLWLGALSYMLADYRTLREPWRDLVLLEQENAKQKEEIRRMTEGILQVAQDLREIPEYEGEGVIGARLRQAFHEVQGGLSSATERDDAFSPEPVHGRYRFLIQEMHASLESLDRELDILAEQIDPKTLYALGGSSWEGTISEKTEKVLEAANRALIERRLRKIADEIGIAPRVALSMAKVESRFDHKAVSPRGAIGVLQVMPHLAWEQYEVTAEKLFDPDVNIRIGLSFLKDLMERFDDNLELSLAAYNAGPGRVIEAGYQVPRIRQTQEYVKRVKQAMNEYGSPSWYD